MKWVLLSVEIHQSCYGSTIHQIGLCHRRLQIKISSTNGVNKIIIYKRVSTQVTFSPSPISVHITQHSSSTRSHRRHITDIQMWFLSTHTMLLIYDRSHYNSYYNYQYATMCNLLKVKNSYVLTKLYCH